MAINLATKYEKEIARVFTLKSKVAGTVSDKYNFTGAKSINVYTPVTQPLNDYKRTGSNRYGDPQELQDTVQEMVITQDKSFSVTIDKGNNAEQMNVKDAAEMLSLEIEEQAAPEMDKYALGRFIEYAGAVSAATAEPTKTTICEMISDGMVHMGNKKVPDDNRYIFIGWKWFGKLRLSEEFVKNDELGKRILVNGELGTFMGAHVIAVPDEYLKKGNSQCYFIIYHKNSVLQPKKIQDYFVKENPAGINGALLEGRFLYDAFVLAARCDGVYACVAASTKQATPSFAFSSGVLTVTSAGATGIRVTLDGSDPRFSKDAINIATGGTVTLPSGKTKAKAVAFDDALFTSDVAEDTERTVG